MLKEMLDERVIKKLKLTRRPRPRFGKPGRTFWAASKTPPRKSPSPWSASTWSCPMPTKASTSRSSTPGPSQRVQGPCETAPSTGSEFLTAEMWPACSKGCDGVLVAPGFGERGFEGKIAAVRHVREHNIPFFGICLGMQVACVEFARNVLGLTDANSTEMDANHAQPRHRHDGSPKERHPKRRHHAPGRLRLRPQARLPRRQAPTAAPTSASATATATSSTTTTWPCLRPPGSQATGTNAETGLGRGHRTGQPPVVRGRAVSPRVEKHGGEPASAVCALCAGGYAAAQRAVAQ